MQHQKVTSLFVSRWSPTLVLEKALSCLTSLIGREAVEPGWYERYWKINCGVISLRKTLLGVRSFPSRFPRAIVLKLHANTPRCAWHAAAPSDKEHLYFFALKQLKNPQKSYQKIWSDFFIFKKLKYSQKRGLEEGGGGEKTTVSTTVCFVSQCTLLNAVRNLPRTSQMVQF